MATVATVAMAGVTFGLVVLVASVITLWTRKRRANGSACAMPEQGPVDVTMGSARPSGLE